MSIAHDTINGTPLPNTQYTINKNQKEEMKQMIQDLTGGRISVLAKMVTEINSGRPLEGK
jgi:hypothetical protein